MSKRRQCKSCLRYLDESKFAPRQIRCNRCKNMRLRYGVEWAEYQLLLDRQDGTCAICKNRCTVKTVLSVDHCHKTKKVRGLLCNKCNLVLGNVGDSIQILESAIKYLKGSKCKKRQQSR